MKKPKQKKKPREFNMGARRMRHIALQIYYAGENYSGFASQTSSSGGDDDGADPINTVEKQLFMALEKTRLAPVMSDGEKKETKECLREAMKKSPVMQTESRTVPAELAS